MKYYLKFGDEAEREVSKEAFVQAERNAGFRPKSGIPGDVATAGFGSGTGSSKVAGRVDYEPEDLAAIHKKPSNF